MAAALTHEIRAKWPSQPSIIIVEPESAACLKESVDAKQITTVYGPSSNMGRLDCKTPSLLAYEVLKQDADRFVIISDEVAKAAAANLRQFGITTTASGAAGYAAMRDIILPQDANSLVIVTEGEV